jgi:hypothetical protein
MLQGGVAMLPEEIDRRGNRSRPQNLEGFTSKRSPVSSSTAKRTYTKTAEAVAGLGVLALSGALFYRVRELLAALLLFSVVLGVVIIAVLILWLVGEATHEAAGRLETRVAHIPARHIVATSRGHAGHILRSLPWN